MPTKKVELVLDDWYGLWWFTDEEDYRGFTGEGWDASSAMRESPSRIVSSYAKLEREIARAHAMAVKRKFHLGGFNEHLAASDLPRMLKIIPRVYGGHMLPEHINEAFEITP
jgi:hypothetical protein